MEQEQLIINKKKKKKFINFENQDDSSKNYYELLHKLREKLKNIFREHIGEQNSIHIVDLFEKLYNASYYEMDVYKRSYWIQVMTNIVKSLRSKDECFIIMRKHTLFVLKTMNEYEYYKKLCNNDIEKLKDAKVRALNWVMEEKWKEL